MSKEVRVSNRLPHLSHASIRPLDTGCARSGAAQDALVVASVDWGCGLGLWLNLHGEAGIGLRVRPRPSGKPPSVMTPDPLESDWLQDSTESPVKSPRPRVGRQDRIAGMSCGSHPGRDGFSCCRGTMPETKRRCWKACTSRFLNPSYHNRAVPNGRI